MTSGGYRGVRVWEVSVELSAVTVLLDKHYDYTRSSGTNKFCHYQAMKLLRLFSDTYAVVYLTVFLLNSCTSQSIKCLLLNTKTQ